MNGPRYAKEEIKTVMDNIHLSCEEIAALLHNRSKESVMQYFFNRKIKKPKARNKRYYSDEKKAEVKAFLLQNLGEPLRVTSEKFGICVGTIGRWYNEALSEL